VATASDCSFLFASVATSSDSAYIKSHVRNLSNPHQTTYTQAGAAPASGSVNYIQNQYASAQTADMWITGTAKASSLSDGYIIMSLAQINRSDGDIELQFNNGHGVNFFGNTATPINFTTTGAMIAADTIQSPTAKFTNLTSGVIPFADATKTLTNSGFSWNSTTSKGGVNAVAITESFSVGSGNIGLGYNDFVANNVIKTFATAHSASNRGASIGIGMNDGGGFVGVSVIDTASITSPYNAQYISISTHEGGVAVGEIARFNGIGQFLLGYKKDPTSGNKAAINGNLYVNGTLTTTNTVTAPTFKMTTGAAAGYLPVSGADGTFTLTAPSTILSGYATEAFVNDTLSDYRLLTDGVIDSMKYESDYLKIFEAGNSIPDSVGIPASQWTTAASGVWVNKRIGIGQDATGQSGDGALLNVYNNALSADKIAQFITPSTSCEGIYIDAGGNYLFYAKSNENLGSFQITKAGNVIQTGGVSMGDYAGTPQYGSLQYNTVSNVMQYYNGAAWVTLASGGGGGGTVYSVAAGNGMNFTTITGAGSVTMGTPSDVTSTSTNGFPAATTHTHALDNSGVSAGSYTSANITVDAKGRITSAANGSGGTNYWQLSTNELLPTSASYEILLGGISDQGAYILQATGDTYLNGDLKINDDFISDNGVDTYFEIRNVGEGNTSIYTGDSSPGELTIDFNYNIPAIQFYHKVGFTGISKSIGLAQNGSN